MRVKRCEKCGLIIHKNSKGCSLKCENNKIRGIKMTKKKKEVIIIDDKLEIITPEVEFKMGMDSLISIHLYFFF